MKTNVELKFKKDNKRVIAEIFNSDKKETVVYLFSKDDFRLEDATIIADNIVISQKVESSILPDKGIICRVVKDTEGNLYEVYNDASVLRVEEEKEVVEEVKVEETTERVVIEGIYCDSYNNRKLNRVGMTYDEYAKLSK